MIAYSRSRLWALFCVSTLLMLSGCLNSEKPIVFANPSSLMSTGYWQNCQTIADGSVGYSCQTWKVQAMEDGRVVAYSRATSKGAADNHYEFQATSLGSGLFMFQLFKREGDSLKGPIKISSFGFGRRSHREFDAILPACNEKVLTPILAAMGLQPNPRPCTLSDVYYTEKEIGSIMRAYAAIEDVPIAFRFRLSKLDDETGAKNWEQDRLLLQR